MKPKLNESDDFCWQDCPDCVLRNTEVDIIYRCLAEHPVSAVERYSIANKLLALKKKHKKIKFIIEVEDD